MPRGRGSLPMGWWWGPRSSRRSPGSVRWVRSPSSGPSWSAPLFEHAGRFILLGLVQGVSEFLPISSDGHLVILDRWLKTPGDNLMVIVLLHLGSLAALLWAFRRDLAA